MQILQGDAARTALSRSFNDIPVPESVLERNEQLYGERLTPEQVVERILADVRARGDAALLDWTEKVDGFRPTLQVTSEEIQAATIEPELHQAILLAIRRVRDFYLKQPAHGWIDHAEGGALGQLVRPLSRVGVYVPGGLAPLISTLIHTAVPAQVAGVPEIIVTTPPNRQGQIHPAILVAAREIGISQVFRVGGAQAIAALAYGTSSIPRVDKAAGPGNLFVVIAKRAGVRAGRHRELARPHRDAGDRRRHRLAALRAADLLAQAEHLGAEPVLVSTAANSGAVQAELGGQIEALPEPNRSWARESAQSRMKIVMAAEPNRGAGPLQIVRAGAPVLY